MFIHFVPHVTFGWPLLLLSLTQVTKATLVISVTPARWPDKGDSLTRDWAEKMTIGFGLDPKGIAKRNKGIATRLPSCHTTAYHVLM